MHICVYIFIMAYKNWYVRKGEQFSAQCMASPHKDYKIAYCFLNNDKCNIELLIIKSCVSNQKDLGYNKCQEQKPECIIQYLTCPLWLSW